MKPLLLLGAGARDAITDVIVFAERWQIPMETTWNAVDLVPYDHPLFVGRPGIVATRGSNLALQSCDWLLALGARLDPPTIAYDYAGLAPQAEKYIVDIDPSEQAKIPGTSWHYLGDVGEFIRERGDWNWFGSADWVAQCAEWKKSRLEGDTVSYHLMDILSDKLPEDAVIVMDSGCQAVNIFCAGFRNKAGQRFMQSSCGLGSMGAAISVSIGAAIASKKRVYCISGDGSFSMNMQELEVARRLNLPITFFVIDNGGYASIRSSELRAFDRTKSSETLPEVRRMAYAFDMVYLGMTSPRLFNWKMLSDKPTIVDVIAPEDELPIPRVMFDGRGKLDDMYPYQDD